MHAMVAQTFNSRTSEAEVSDLHEYNAGLVYRVSLSTAKSVQRKHVLKNQKKQTSNLKTLIWNIILVI